MPPTEGGRHRQGIAPVPAADPKDPASDESRLDPPTSAAPGGMRRQAVRSFAWTGLQTVAVRLLSLVTFTVLARLLSPHDYGVAAVAGVFAALSALLAAGGFSQAIVQKQSIDRTDVDSIFWVGMSIGVALAVLTVVGAWPLAHFFRLPELKPVLWVLSPMYVAIAVSSTQTGLLQREFRFGTLARITVSANVFATVIGLVAAFLGAGYWALIIQTLIAPVYSACALWIVSDYRPGFTLSRERFLALFSTSRQFMGDRLMTFTYEQTDKAAVGRELGPAVLGVYSVAYRLIQIMLEVLAGSVQSVALPSFARVQRDKRRLSEGYVTAIRLCTTVSMPIFVYTGVAAHDVVVVLFGAKWVAAVPAMQVFCVYGAVQSLLAYNTVFLQAVGHARTVLWMAVGGSLLQVVAVILAVPHGTTWVAASFLLRALVMTPVVIGFVVSVLPRGVLGATIAAILPPAVGSAAIAATAGALVHWSAIASSWIAVAVSLMASALAYLGVVAIVGPRHLREVRQAVGMLRGRSEPA